MDSLSPRFPDMSAVYDKDLLQLARKSALVYGIPLRKGVYVGLTGPSLETPAETRFLKLIGADAVGMSTVSEVIAGVHCGMRVCTIVVITNVNLPDCMQKTSIEEVVEAADSAGACFRICGRKLSPSCRVNNFFYNELLDKIGIDIDFTIHRQKPGGQPNTARIFIDQP
jgi:purine-nucleoside phosphorylase